MFIHGCAKEPWCQSREAKQIRSLFSGTGDVLRKVEAAKGGVSGATHLEGLGEGGVILWEGCLAVNRLNGEGSRLIDKYGVGPRDASGL